MRLTAGSMICLGLLILPRAVCAQGNETRTFERICQDVQKSPGAQTQKKLIAFCKRTRSRQLAGLGYFLAGYRELQNEKPGAAADWLEKASLIPGPLDDFVYYHWAESLFRDKQYLKTREKCEIVLSQHPDSPLREKALSLFREAALASQEPQVVLDSLKFSPNLPADADALFYSARGQEALGKWQPALLDYQRLHYLFPLHPKGLEVSQRISALTQANGNVEGTVSDDWKLTRIEKLYQARRYTDVLKDLESLVQSNQSLAGDPRLQLWRGVSEFGAGRYPEAIEILTTLKNADREALAHASFITAESFRKLGNYASFQQYVETMEQQYPSSKWLEEALFSLGNYHLVRRNLSDSTAAYQKLVAQFPQGAHSTDCHWRIGWYYYRQKNYAKALEVFLEHPHQYKDSPYVAASLYWAGRSKEKLGNLEEAAQFYRALRQRTPNSYYGQLSKKRLEENADNAPTQWTAEIDRLASTLDRRSKEAGTLNWEQLLSASFEPWPRVKALKLIRLLDLAARELQRKETYGESPAVNLQTARLYYEGRNFGASIPALRKLLPGYLDASFGDIPKPVWEMLYPADYLSVIIRESRRQKLDPYWVLSLIRQESAFNPKALSSANAHGLMQLLPTTARLVAKQLKTKRPAPARLFDPTLNIRLGTRHFADLLSHFNGQVEMALASYNAGAERVEIWSAEGGYSDSAEFVETIPFSETRNYVKVISRGYWFYKTLYGSLDQPVQKKVSRRRR